MTRCSSIRGMLTALVYLSILAVPASAALQPFSVYFDDQFRGYDGLWSAAQIGVGTPVQYLSLLPNTVSSETWVADPAPCAGSLQCQQERGGLFYDDRSSTWDEVGFFEMGYNLAPTALGAEYGFDTITLSNSVSASNQTVGLFNTTELWLGSLGLSVKESTFVGPVTHLSLISSLVHNESAIPSNSYGYTAGAHYAERSLAGSLTLGGTDITRYTPSGLSFKLDSANYAPLVAIKSITAMAQAVSIPPTWNTNPRTLMAEEDAAVFTVDSSTPFLWMPQNVCDSFASALNLTYSSDIDLYVFPNTNSPQNLTGLGLVFTFTLAESTTSGTTITIPISYEAFNLQVSYPFPGLNATSSSAPVNYFPLRRANSSQQYIIGRSFLQEAYITVDYERGNFSLSAAVFPDLTTVSPQLVPITRPANSIFLPPQGENATLSKGAKAGIGVGVAVAVILAALAAIFFIRRRRAPAVTDEKTEKKRSFNLLRFVKQRKDSSNVVTELAGDKRQPKEMQADATNTRFELPANDPVEMPAGDIPDSYLQNNKDLEESSSSEDGARPNSMEKGVMGVMQTVSERSHSPVPPYSPADVTGQSNTNSTGNSTTISSAISPTSPHFASAFTGSHSSGEQGISPIAQSASMSGSFPKPDNTDSTTSSTSSAEASTQTSQHQPSSSLNSQTRNSLPGTRASLQLDSTPNRTVSRNSRFREEIVDEEPTQTVEDERPHVIRERFSWEQ